MIKEAVVLLYICCFTVKSQGTFRERVNRELDLKHDEGIRTYSPHRRHYSGIEHIIETSPLARNIKYNDRPHGYSRAITTVTTVPQLGRLVSTRMSPNERRKNSDYGNWKIFADNRGTPAHFKDNAQNERITVDKSCISAAGGEGQRCLRKLRKQTNIVENNRSTDKISSGGRSEIEENALLSKDATDNDRSLTSTRNRADKPKSLVIKPDEIEKLSIKIGSNSCGCYWRPEKCGCDCEGSLNYDDFQEISRSFFPCRNFTFTMNGGNHYALPPNFFSKIKNVDEFNLLITNSTFEYICDPTPMTSPFKGVVFANSALIKLSDVSVRRGWNWKPFEQLQSSSEAQVNIILEDCKLRRLTSDFSNLAKGHVDTIDISKSNLEMVGSNAFGTFQNMTHFRLPGNKIQQLRRTDFPEMLFKLEEIDLRHNELRNLDDDLFINMPSLKEILLSGNPLTVLSENTFRSIISKANLVGISDIPLTCDCRMQWLKIAMLNDDATKRNMKGAICKRPSYLRGIPLDYLSKEHLLC